jgi:hypothetical protein
MADDAGPSGTTVACEECGAIGEIEFALECDCHDGRWWCSAKCVQAWHEEEAMGPESA